jgi:hypothetical protein
MPVVLAGFDPEGGALNFHIVSQPSHGTLNLKSQTSDSATYAYTPAPDYFGLDSNASWQLALASVVSRQCRK